MKPLTILTTLAVITVAWVGLTVMPDGDTPDRPDPAPPAPTTQPDPDGLSDSDPVDDVSDTEATSRDGEALTVESAVSHPVMERSGMDETHAELRFDAADREPETRAPLNVALVVDRSGSMRGNPIDRAREAVHTFVDELEAGDRISLVSFSTGATTEVGSIAVEEGRGEVRRAIERLSSGGSTNISAGIQTAYSEVDRHSRPEMVERVVLMTDGMPNRGIDDAEGLSTKTAQLRKNGVSVSTLGFGANYDAELLASMATEGAGNFRHVSNAGDLEAAFADEIDDLTSTVASGLQVDVRPRDGVDIGDIYGFSVDDIDGGKRITLGDLEAEGERSAVIALRADAVDLEAGDLRRLLDVRVRYVDRLVDDRIAEDLEMTTEITAEPAAVDDNVNGRVVARVQEQRALQSLQEVDERFRAGDRDGARRQIEHQRQRLEKTREEHGLAEGAFDAVGDVLDDKENEVESVEVGSPEARESQAATEDDKLEIIRGK